MGFGQPNFDLRQVMLWSFEWVNKNFTKNPDNPRGVAFLTRGEVSKHAERSFDYVFTMKTLTDQKKISAVHFGKCFLKFG
jgi:hypothetical protein